MQKYHAVVLMLVMFTGVAQAEIVRFACPTPEKIKFNGQGSFYQASAKMQRLRGDYWPLPIMEGFSNSPVIHHFTAATHNSKGDGYFSCHYALSQFSQSLVLKNPPAPGLKYCHFFHIGPKPDVDACQGSIEHCAIECDMND